MVTVMSHGVYRMVILTGTRRRALGLCRYLLLGRPLGGRWSESDGIPLEISMSFRSRNYVRLHAFPPPPSSPLGPGTAGQVPRRGSQGP